MPHKGLTFLLVFTLVIRKTTKVHAVLTSLINDSINSLSKQSPNAKIGKFPLFSTLRFVTQMFSFWSI